MTIKQLIVNADDFGLHENINLGIIQAHLKGCVTSTSIIAGGSAFQQAVLLARQCPDLGVGVHLTLVGGLRPVARDDVHSILTHKGNFFDNYQVFVRQYLKGRIKSEDIETEFRCQLQKVVGNGIKITHLDSHQHLHALPGLSKIVGRLAKEFVISKIRIPAEPFFFFNTEERSWGRFLGRGLLSTCALWSRSRYCAEGLVGSDHFFGMLSGGKTNQVNLKSILMQLPEGISEIMVHPGLDNQVLNSEYHWEYHWQDELQALQSPETLQLINEKNIKLINYRHLPI